MYYHTPYSNIIQTLLRCVTYMLGIEVTPKKVVPYPSKGTLSIKGQHLLLENKKTTDSVTLRHETTSVLLLWNLYFVKERGKPATLQYEHKHSLNTHWPEHVSYN